MQLAKVADTKEVVARFEAERQTLALMDHPNIAKVFDAEGTAYAALQRLICEVEPPKPSTKVSTLGKVSVAVAQNRSIDAKKLDSLLRGDLDCWGLMVTAQPWPRMRSSSTIIRSRVQELLHKHMQASNKIDAKPSHCRSSKSPSAPVLGREVGMLMSEKRGCGFLSSSAPRQRLLGSLLG
jgi:hypothetical protein